MHSKKQYIAPTLTVVTFKTERGYQASGLQVFKVFSNIATPGVEIASSQEDWDATENLFGDNNTWDN